MNTATTGESNEHACSWDLFGDRRESSLSHSAFVTWRNGSRAAPEREECRATSGDVARHKGALSFRSRIRLDFAAIPKIEKDSRCNTACLREGPHGANQSSRGLHRRPRGRAYPSQRGAPSGPKHHPPHLRDFFDTLRDLGPPLNKPGSRVLDREEFARLAPLSIPIFQWVNSRLPRFSR